MIFSGMRITGKAFNANNQTPFHSKLEKCVRCQLFNPGRFFKRAQQKEN